MSTLLGLYQVEVMWNREFYFSRYSTPTQDFDSTKKIAEDIINSGDGARVKKYRIINADGDVVYPLKNLPKESHYPKMYKCDYCGKKELGKPYSYLINPSPTGKHDIALKPINWDWVYVHPCKSDRILWSCGCHKFN